jgi:hypothetical protein
MSHELHTQPIPDELADEAEARIERKLHSESTLDALISSRLDDDGQPIPPKPVRDFEDFVEARPYLEELKERHGTDTVGIVDKFSYYNTELKNHGELGAELLRGDYLKNTNVAKLLHIAEKQKQESESTSTANKPEKDELSGVRLDRKIEEAFEKTDERARAKLEFDAANEKFKALKAENPNLTWKEFSKATAQLDRELWRNPDFANRLAAASGVPVTPLQMEMTNLQLDQNRKVDSIEKLLLDMQGTGELTDFERLAPTMMNVLQDPNFPKTYDPRTDARNAHWIAQRAELYHLREIEQQSAVEKARWAAPVKSSGGVPHAGAGRGSLDSLIASATSHIADD